MLPPILEIAALPFITGAVGYFTNKLAIKMLFRPYEPKWYTFGWQGIVPRTRPTLAKKVGKMVGSHLLSPKDLENAILSPSFQAFLNEKTIEKLQNITPDDIKKFIPFDDIKSSICNNSEIFNNVLNEFIANILENDTLRSLIASKVTENIITDDTLVAISNEVTLKINNCIYSGRTLEETLPSALLSQKDKITNYISQAVENAIKQTARSVDVKNATAEQIIAFKDSFFDKTGADQFKMGMFSMFIDDEMISNAVKREMPSIIDGIIEKPSSRQKIQQSINTEIEMLLKSKLSELADKSGQNTLPSFYSALKTNMTADNFKNEAKETTYKLIIKILSQKNVRNNLNIDMSEIINVLFDIKMVDNLSSLAAKYISYYTENIAATLVSKSTAMLKSGINPAIERLDIERMVEGKINSLKLSEVEEVLFSFMHSHFKWINILGFVIGFIIGAVQAAAVILSK